MKTRFYCFASCLLAAATLVATPAFSIQAPGPADPRNRGQRLMPGAFLSADSSEFLQPNNDGALELFMQSDCNVVLYQDEHFNTIWQAPVWATNTYGQGNHCFLAMQTDGNLVLYNENWTPLWASWTQGNPGAFLQIQSDGNLVIYSASLQALWATNTLFPEPGPAGGGGPISHPGCQFSRTDTSCHAFVMTCKEIWVCGWDYQTLTPIEVADGSYVCGGCWSL